MCAGYSVTNNEILSCQFSSRQCNQMNCVCLPQVVSRPQSSSQSTPENEVLCGQTEISGKRQGGGREGRRREGRENSVVLAKEGEGEHKGMLCSCRTAVCACAHLHLHIRSVWAECTMYVCVRRRRCLQLAPARLCLACRQFSRSIMGTLFTSACVVRVSHCTAVGDEAPTYHRMASLGL